MEHKSETKNCQNCKNNFIIEPEDFSFYEKIKVPPPTFCHECRIQRRMTYRNTHSLYKRKDSFSGKDIISIYSPDKDLVVIDQATWWGDSWDPMSYGKDYQFDRSFFSQWYDFRNHFPLQSLSNSKAVNSDYCNVAEESKDSYLCSASWKIERVLYSDGISEIKDCMDLHKVHRTDFSYEDIVCTDSYQLFYSQNSTNCVNSYFLYDCRGCTDCFMCSNLRNKNYCFKNQQLTKEGYLQILKEIDLGSYFCIKKNINDFENLKLNSIHRFSLINNSYNVSGNNIEQSKNCHNCFDISGENEDCKNVFWAVKAKDSHDCGPGLGGASLAYETFDAGVGGNNILFSSVVYYSNNIEYSFNCYNSSDLFACIGLRNKKYCIFNKQYTKEEYISLRKKIIQHMNNMPYIDKKGNIYKYGEFFPIELSTFCYNETIAQDYHPLEKEKALTLKIPWKNKEDRDYKPTVKANELADNIKDVKDDILDDIIECEHTGLCKCRCSTAFKITPEELIFYRRFNIPLPRICYGCRHYSRLNRNNPTKLYLRTCMKNGCNNKFETTYSPNRPEVVYCEKCYQQEIY
jgi:hypothetical protein